MEIVKIGVIESPYLEQQGTPLHPVYIDESWGRIVISPEFRNALADLDGFNRLWIISWLDRSNSYDLKVIPFRDTVERGLFATRYPKRPNPIGISAANIKSIQIETGIIELDGVDLLNGTPVLDLKPYIPAVDSFPDATAGWFEASNTTTADDR